MLGSQLRSVHCKAGYKCGVYGCVFSVTVGEGNKPIDVTSKDLISRNPNYAPAHITGSSEEALEGEGIRIVALAPGQALRVECEAILVWTK